MRSKEIPGRVHPVIPLFAMCQGMRFTHLPESGGLYDQNPDLVDHFGIIFQAQAEQQQREAAERNAKMEAEKNKPKSRRGR